MAQRLTPPSLDALGARLLPHYRFACNTIRGRVAVAATGLGPERSVIYARPNSNMCVT